MRRTAAASWMASISPSLSSTSSWNLWQSMERVKEAGFEERHRLEKGFKERLKGMDAKLRAVREKERRIAQMERLQARSQEKCSRLQADITSIKQQKVRLQHASTLPCSLLQHALRKISQAQRACCPRKEPSISVDCFD